MPSLEIGIRSISDMLELSFMICAVWLEVLYGRFTKKVNISSMHSIFNHIKRKILQL